MTASVVFGVAVARTGNCAAAQPLSVLPGDLFELRLPHGGAPPESAVFLGKAFPALFLPGEPGGLFLLGTDLDAPPGDQQIIVRL
jgi:hypothetical protein